MLLQHISLQTRRQLQDTQIEPRVVQVEWRLLAIPVLFIFLRIWGTIQLIVSLSMPSNHFGVCITPQLHTAYLALGILQVCCQFVLPSVPLVLNLLCGAHSCITIAYPVVYSV